MWLFVSGPTPPTLTWWKDEALIDDTYEVINNETTNILVIPQVERKDLNAMFTCQAVSQQLDIPVSTQVRLDLTCKSILNVFIASGAPLFRLGLDE